MGGLCMHKSIFIFRYFNVNKEKIGTLILIVIVIRLQIYVYIFCPTGGADFTSLTRISLYMYCREINLAYLQLYGFSRKSKWFSVMIICFNVLRK